MMHNHNDGTGSSSRESMGRTFVLLPQTKLALPVPRRAHHLARGLLAIGHRLTWVDEGRSLPGLVKSSLLRQKHMVTEAEAWISGAKVIRPAIPWPLPPSLLRSFALSWFLRAFHVRRIAKSISDQDAAVLLVEHAWHLQLTRLLKNRLPSAVIVYLMSDDLPYFENTPRKQLRIKAMQEELIAQADGVVSVVPLYLEKYVGADKPMLVLPNGVSIEAMTRSAFSGVEKILHLPRPRLGFVGAVTEAFDFSLVEQLVREQPEWTFLFAGTIHPDVRIRWNRLSSAPNVFHVGIVPYQALGSVLQLFDVGLIPLDVDHPQNGQLDDLKLKEYLAFGVPVVTANEQAVFSYEPGAVWKVDNCEEYATVVQEAIDCRNVAELVSRRKQLISEEYDWTTLAGRLAEFAISLRGTK